MHRDGVVARLLLLLLHGRNEVDHAFALGGDPDLRPAVEVELSHDPGLLLLAGQGLPGGKGASVLPHRRPPCPPGDSGHGVWRPAELPTGWPPGQGVCRPWSPSSRRAAVPPSGWGSGHSEDAPPSPQGPPDPFMGSLAALLELTGIIPFFKEARTLHVPSRLEMGSF